MAIKRNHAPLNNGPPPPPPWSDPEFARDFPSLHSFLKDTQYDDGGKRITGSLSIFVMDGALKCAINDKDRGVVAFTSAVTVNELFALLDEGVCNDSLEWKAGSKGTPQNKPPF